MKRKYLSILLAFFLCILLLLSSPLLVQASFQKEDQCCNTLHRAALCKSENFIYYTINNRIFRYHLKTKKKICLYKSKTYYNFDSLCIKGKQLVCAANKYNGTDFADYDIFSINTDGTHAKTLAKGEYPCFLKGNLYFIKHKKPDFIKYITPIEGIYMIKAGSSKIVSVKKSSSIQTLTTDGTKLYYSSYNNSTKTRWYSYLPSTKKIVFLAKINKEYCEELSVSSSSIFYNSKNHIYCYHVSKKTDDQVISLHTDFSNGMKHKNTLYYTDQNADQTSSLNAFNLKTKKTKKLLSADSIGYLYWMDGYLGYTIYTNSGEGPNTFLMLRLPNGSSIKLGSYFTS
ncbi:hypothetical protein lbkm_2483 [Lachnospiraceae bacterium KM106-2]|nr:hypothetical protein lbkm_2483 [Lachnospiraceae bacterium KM106-2]